MKSRRLAASTTPHSDQQARENARRATFDIGGNPFAAVGAAAAPERGDLQAMTTRVNPGIFTWGRAGAGDRVFRGHLAGAVVSWRLVVVAVSGRAAG
jgi:hypothetical protein